MKTWYKPSVAQDLKVAADALYAIFLRAVQLARKLRRQRALWSVRFPSNPEKGRLRFDPTFMENHLIEEDEVDLEELRKWYVELIATPVLYKRGTMNGEWFEIEEAVQKAVVIILDPGTSARKSESVA